MNNYDWPGEFRQVYHAASQRYDSGERTPARLFSKAELEFLAAIGCSAQELFDFIDDAARYGEPDFETVLTTTAIRRDYFFLEQHQVPSRNVVDMEVLPPKAAEVDGIPWLPRLIEKARAKLRGEMPPDLMYGCGGDRPFLQGVNVGLAEFLQVVWHAGEDNRKIVEYVKKHRAQSGRA